MSVAIRGGGMPELQNLHGALRLREGRQVMDLDLMADHLAGNIKLLTEIIHPLRRYRMVTQPLAQALRRCEQLDRECPRMRLAMRGGRTENRGTVLRASKIVAKGTREQKAPAGFTTWRCHACR